MRFVCLPIIVTVIFFGAGCSGPSQLMPTPNVYVHSDVDPFADVPQDLRDNKVDVLYVTDRVPESKSPEDPKYGFRRSRSVAIGNCEVQFGKDVSWDELVAASRTSKRKVSLPVTITRTDELVRLPETPRVLFDDASRAATQQMSGATDVKPANYTEDSELSREYHQKVDQATALLSQRLARSPVKEVYVFVHGYNNTFADSVTTIAELWHFFGRRGVPIAYSWPAGRGGLLRGYTYDRESGEFTVYHLKQMLRAIASCPDVQKIHIIAHSRGTDVLTTALRELHLEITGSGKSTRKELKLGAVVLAAPDLDVDVVFQRLITARLGRVPEQTAVYICSKDNALGISNWLFGGLTRLGKIQSQLFTPSELQSMRKFRSVQIVDARVSNSGQFGHNYFHANPAVSSDLVLLMRYHRLPGEDTGRPLGVDPEGFWYIQDNYPGNKLSLKADATP